MRNLRFGLLAIVVLAAATVSTPAAQEAAKRKKLPKQTVDRGFDDPATDALQAVERTRDSVRLSVRQDGVLVAQLDESFEDALIATRQADGTVTFACLHGLPAGARHAAINQAPAPTTPSRAEEK